MFSVQVLGHKEGLEMMEKADPLFLLISLPAIPVILIISKMIRWEDYILRLWRKHSAKLPLLNYLWPDGKKYRPCMIQGAKLLGFRGSETPKNAGRNPKFGTGFPTGNPGKRF